MNDEFNNTGVEPFQIKSSQNALVDECLHLFDKWTFKKKIFFLFSETLI